MSRDHYYPIPAGYISLFDYSRLHGYDLVDLVCAKDRGDIPAWVWTLKEGRGIGGDPVYATIFKADMIPPFYCRRFDYKHNKHEQDATRTYTNAGISRRLLVNPGSIAVYLKNAGLDVKDCASDEEYSGYIEACRQQRDANVATGKAHFGAYNGRYVAPPSGYATVVQKSYEWGLSKARIYEMAKAGRIKHLRVNGLYYIPLDEARPDRLPGNNQHAARPLAVAH